MTVSYNEYHKKIIESGAAEIKKVFSGNDTKLIKELLFCLDYYLDPFYGHTLPYENEIFDLLRELAASSRDDDVTNDCLQLIGDHSHDSFER